MAENDATPEALRSNNPCASSKISDKEEIVDSIGTDQNLSGALTVQSFDEKENLRYIQILTFSTKLEHIGDIIDKSLMELAMKNPQSGQFSRQGFAEISDLHSRVMDSIQLAQNVFMTSDVKMARKLFEEKASLRSYEMHAAESHFKRLSEGVAETIATSSLHLVFLALRRVNSYITLCWYPILEEAHELNPSLLKPERTEKKKKGKTKASKSLLPRRRRKSINCIHHLAGGQYK